MNRRTLGEKPRRKERTSSALRIDGKENIEEIDSPPPETNEELNTSHPKSNRTSVYVPGKVNFSKSG